MKPLYIITAFVAIIIAVVVIACNSSASNADITKTTAPLNIGGNTTNKHNWIGSWDRREWQADATLEVKSIKNDSLIFDLSSSDGGHTGEIEGSAFIKNNEATFVSTEVKGCKLVMRIIGDSVINITDQNTCISYGGMGVGFSGRFINTKILPKEKAQTLVGLNILDTKQDAIFRALVDTGYQRFVDCTEMIEDRTGQKPLDNFDAKVIASGVRGLYMYMEYIIMIDKQDHIWAAVINDNKVFYYTNSKQYADKLPNTIEDWRSGFKDYPVIYKAKI
jgi:hypothetical protein